MAYLLADLVDTPHLRLTLRAGADGLNRPVSWAQTSDLEDPWSWLAGGELLMKNGRTLPESAKGQIALIRGLAEKGICGIVIGLDSATPDLTPAAVALADELGVSRSAGAIFGRLRGHRTGSGRRRRRRRRRQAHGGDRAGLPGDPPVGESAGRGARAQPIESRRRVSAGRSRRRHGRSGTRLVRSGAGGPAPGARRGDRRPPGCRSRGAARRRGR